MTSSNEVPRTRKVALNVATYITNMLTGLKMTDTHNGMIGIKTGIINRLKLDETKYAFHSQLIAEVSRNEIIYKELPTNTKYTNYSLSKGQSLIDGLLIIEDIINVLGRR